jgi:hypothetical protein
LTAIYHNVIRNDLMRRVIHPAELRESMDGPDPRTSSIARIPAEALAIGDWEIPFEFSHGAPSASVIAMVRPGIPDQ